MGEKYFNCHPVYILPERYMNSGAPHYQEDEDGLETSNEYLARRQLLIRPGIKHPKKMYVSAQRPYRFLCNSQPPVCSHSQRNYAQNCIHAAPQPVILCSQQPYVPLPQPRNKSCRHPSPLKVLRSKTLDRHYSCTKRDPYPLSGENEHRIYYTRKCRPINKEIRLIRKSNERAHRKSKRPYGERKSSRTKLKKYPVHLVKSSFIQPSAESLGRKRGSFYEESESLSEDFSNESLELTESSSENEKISLSENEIDKINSLTTDEVSQLIKHSKKCSRNTGLCECPSPSPCNKEDVLRVEGAATCSMQCSVRDISVSACPPQCSVRDFGTSPENISQFEKHRKQIGIKLIILGIVIILILLAALIISITWPKK